MIDTAKWLREEEGYRDVVYLDSKGIETVGYGHRVTKVDKLELGDKVSAKRCADWFWADLGLATNQAMAILVPIHHPPDVLHVVTCMIYQMGYTGTKDFKRTMKLIKKQRYAMAAVEMMDSQWARQDTPARAKRLALVMAGLA